MIEARVRDTSPLVDGDVVFEGWEPVPAVSNPMKGRSKYPFEQLEPKSTMRIRRAKENVKSALRTWAKVHGGKYTVRDVGGGWTKVWRLK